MEGLLLAIAFTLANFTLAMAIAQAFFKKGKK